jgi:hypothetical protein
MYAKHIATQPLEQLLPMTTAVHGRISTGTNTLMYDIQESSLPESGASSSFRKASRPTGVTVQRMAPAANISSDTMGSMIQGSLAPVAAKEAPGAMAATFKMSSLNAAIVAVSNVANPAAVSFNISLPTGPPAQASTTVAQNFHSSFTPYVGVFETANWLPPVSNPNLATPSNVISDSINPASTHLDSFYNHLSVNNQVYVPPTPDRIVPIMVAPMFKYPMYETLKELGMDFFIPNLHLLPQNSMTLLQSNQKFIEAYLAGVNYEMGRELLWREYPTDQRGTYFKHFWNSIYTANTTEDDTADIAPINEWLSNTALGTHSERNGSGSNNLVLAVRGDFLKKFPNAAIFAVEGDWDTANYSYPVYLTKPRKIKLNSQTNTEDIKYPIFTARVEPDITFLGFDITAEQAKGNRDHNGGPSNPPSPGWFFVIMERPGELRFGLDMPTSPPQTELITWADLAWNHVDKNPAGYLKLTQHTIDFDENDVRHSEGFEPSPDIDVAWGEDSSAMAQILYQSPVKVLIHANEMIP